MWQTLLCGKRRIIAAGDQGCRCPTRRKGARVGGGQMHRGQQQHVSSNGTSWAGTWQNMKIQVVITHQVTKHMLQQHPHQEPQGNLHAPVGLTQRGERRRQDSNKCVQWPCDGVPEDRRDYKTSLSIIMLGPHHDRQGDHAITFMLRDIITKARHHKTDTQQTDTAIQTAYTINQLEQRDCLALAAVHTYATWEGSAEIEAHTTGAKKTGRIVAHRAHHG